MPVFHLLPSDTFPPTSLADEDGLLAFEFDLTVRRLLEAYPKGIFPWYNEGEPVQWWSPDPRFVLFPEKLKIAKSMKSVLNKQHWNLRIDTDFDAIITHCQQQERRGQDGTWISDDIITCYTKLFKMGIVHCAGCYEGDELIGGLYGVRVGQVFCGESMFSLKSNASKYAFIRFVEHLMQEGVTLIDCQVYTPHLESLGAEFISREEFEEYLRRE